MKSRFFFLNGSCGSCVVLRMPDAGVWPERGRAPLEEQLGVLVVRDKKETERKVG